ncbi:MAG: glycosyltransferase family 4 protein, partial [Deltaproteobacteria bacterium]|nr:glycosyltransferase family 4 protein [Deltaproteobacteria bacterium]
MKNILFIDSDGGWGGAPKSLLTLVRYLDPNAFRPVLLIGMPGPVIEEYNKKGISVFVQPLSRFVYHRNNRGSILKKLIMMVLMGPKVIINLRKIVKLEGVDLVHINSVVILPTALLFKMFFRLPVIFHVREMLLKNVIGKIQNKLIYVSGDKIVVPSENEARQFAKQKECDKILVRYNPVDIREFQFSSVERERIRRELKVDQEAIIISTIGAIVPGKGQDRIIEIVRGIKKTYDGKIKFFIVGKIDIPEEKGRLKKLLRFVWGENKLQKFQLEL